MSYRSRRIRWDRVIGAFIVLIILIFLLGFCISSCGSQESGDQSSAGSPLAPLSSNADEPYVIGGDASSVPDDVSSSAAGNEPSADFVESVQIAGDVYAGNLVLVNQENPSHLSEDDLNLVNVARDGDYASNYSNIYSVSYPAHVRYNADALTSFNKMVRAYYDAKHNGELMFNYGYLKQDDPKSNPESACGLDVQLHLKKNDGTYGYITNSGDYAWIFENMYKYGFIQRYPEEKQDLTGVKGTYTALRYVGIPHAAYIHENNLCLEEYLTMLKEQYTYGTGMLRYSYSEQEFLIYYVPASMTGDTKVPVPGSGNYEISGNNVDGYIVTAIS